MVLLAPIAEPVRPSPPPPLPPPSAHYTISLRGTHFHVSASLLRMESPNYFTRTLLAPPSAQRISPRSTPFDLDRDPRLFEVVLNYLGGYEILPMSETAFLVDGKTALRNLSKDAEFYELGGLEEMVKGELERLDDHGTTQTTLSSALAEGETENEADSVFDAL